MFLSVTSNAQQDTCAPITKKGLLKALAHKTLPSKYLIQEIKKCGVAFDLSETESDIRAEGKYLGFDGLNALITSIGHNYRVPDAGLRFVGAKEPAVVVINVSDTIVRDIKWTVVLWNADLPERVDPLPIPVSTFDWLRPRQFSGALDMFGRYSLPFLKTGDRLFGSASAICPNCVRGHTYYIYTVWHVGGWFSEVKEETSGSVLIPQKLSKEAILSYMKHIMNIPEGLRISIDDK
jgi:hypothetical protein